MCGAIGAISSLHSWGNGPTMPQAYYSEQKHQDMISLMTHVRDMYRYQLKEPTLIKRRLVNNQQEPERRLCTKVSQQCSSHVFKLGS